MAAGPIVTIPRVDVVVDASAVVLAVAGKTPEALALRTRLGHARCHAPHLIDAEVGNVLRRHVHAGRLTAQEAFTGLRVACVLVDHRYPHTGSILDVAWGLRDNVSHYDALYVAWATRLGITLVTGDSRLSNAPSLPCVVEVV